MRGFELAGDSFRLGYRFQRYWDVSMASAFFCGELGAGLFLVAMVYDSLPGLILGLLIAGVGKSLFHLTHMGVPGRSWRAILRPDRSWVSRGLIAIVVFCGAGTLHTIDTIMGLCFHLVVYCRWWRPRPVSSLCFIRALPWRTLRRSRYGIRR